MVYIDFPQEEHLPLEARYKQGQRIITTRCLDECGKYQVGQCLETPWGRALVTKVTHHQDIATHPYRTELLPDQIRVLQGHSYDVVEMMTEGTHTYSNGSGEWDVRRLWELAADLPIVEMDPEAFHEWEEYNWETQPTLRHVVDHMRRVLAADLAYPIIVSAEGHIMDGNHRLVKAALEGVPVKMVRFTETPPPDRLLGAGTG